MIERDEDDLPHVGPPCWLYRYFDGRDHLLYVGITVDLRRREEQHQASQFARYISAATEHLYPTVPTARAAEQHAIRTEEPLFNLAHVLNWQRPERQRRLDMYLTSIGAPEPMFHGSLDFDCWECGQTRRRHCYACRACVCPLHETTD